MNDGTLYGMITVRSTSDYTVKALSSFFKNTSLTTDDQFILIDNDGDWTANFADLYSVDTVINQTPKNTSQNINQLIRLAAEHKLHLVFLSNDVIFTPQWNTRLILDDNILSIPSCNQTHDYGFAPSLSMEEFQNKYTSLNTMAHLHGAKFKSAPFERLLMPPYVSRMSRKLYDTVGLYDEHYNVGGEDVDYRIRLLKKKFNIKYCSAYLLHFNGRSSWNGAETLEETSTRNARYTEIFKKTWGDDLYNLLLVGGNPKLTIEKYNLWQLLQQEKFNEMILRVANAQ